jgi:hypothetical protein
MNHLEKLLEKSLEELDYLQRIEEMSLDYSWDLETFWFEHREYPISALRNMIQQVEKTIKLIYSNLNSELDNQ